MMLKLAVVLFVACVVVEAGKIQVRNKRQTYDAGMDAGIRGEGDLKHHDGFYVGYDAVHSRLKFVTQTSADTEWKFTSDNRWVHMADGKCVHPVGGLTNPADDTELELRDCNPNNYNAIKFEGLADGQWWNIVHLSSGKCIHPLQGTAADGVRLVIWDQCGRDDRLDYIFVDADGQEVPLM